MRRLTPALALACLWSLGGIAAAGEPDCSDKNARPVAELLISAEAAVASAAERKALWTVAVDALRRAQEAVRAGTCEQAIREAEVAIEFAELGIAQLGYPPYPIR